MSQGPAVRVDSWAHQSGITLRYEADDAILLGLGLLARERVPGPEPRCHRHGEHLLVARMCNGHVRVTLQARELRQVDIAFGRFMQQVLASTPRADARRGRAQEQ